MASQFNHGRNPKDQPPKSIVVIGGGGHAKVLISILRKLNHSSILGYTDREDRGQVLGVPFLGTDQELGGIAARHPGLAAALGLGQVGLGKARCELWTKVQRHFVLFPSVVSPDAIINEDTSIQQGAVIMDGAVINSGSRLGVGAIVNTNCTVEHDVILADWVHVAPGATLSGGVAVGQFSMIGAGATVLEGREIAANCLVGAGAVVTTDLKEPGVYVGCPARRIK
jgi:UDP-perosamine 4-acetyltransferase